MMGRTDCPPTDAGIADCVAKTIGSSFTAIVSSDLQRSAMAAAAIGQRTDLPVAIDPRWRELDFGAWDGLAPNEIDQRALGRFWRDPDACPPHGGERWSVLGARVSAAIADCTAPSTLIVTHAGAMRAALACLCGFEHRQLWSFDIPYAAMLSLKIWTSEPASAQIVGLST
jgi:alpha-ribazole phosphatase